MPTYEFLLFAVRDSIATITLNRPAQLNALNLEIVGELLDAVRQCAADDTVRCVVLTGAGRAFCAGDDLRVFTPAMVQRRGVDIPGSYVRGEGRWPLVVFALRDLPKPVIASVNGYAFGAGLNLALACDLRIMAQSAQLAAPFVKRGLATGTNLLQQYVGIGVAARLLLTGEPVAATEAERLGLVTRVVPDAALADETAATAATLARAATATLGLTKGALYRGWGQDPERAYQLQGWAVHASSSTEDRAEGQRAFLEKRDPRFVGR